MKNRVIYIVGILMIFSSLLMGCEDSEKVLYNKVITSGTYKEIKSESSGKTHYDFLIINDGNKDWKLQITDSEVLRSLNRYVKYKTNTDVNEPIKLDIMYDAQKQTVIGISPIINEDHTTK